MKFISKKIRKIKNDVESPAINSIKSACQKFGSHLRLGARIRLLNIKAIRNPKKYMGSFIAAFGLLFFICILSGVISKNTDTDNESLMNNIASVDTVFNGMRSIHSAKTIQQRNIDELAVTGTRLKREVDSILAIHQKTHEDSLQIYRKAKQLKYIIDNLRQNSNDKN